MQHTFIELGQAQQIADAAIQAAQRAQLPIAIAITDPAGHLVLILRQDRAQYFALDAALRKAVTAGGFRAPTHGLAQWAQRDASFAAAFVGSSELTLLAGGLPIASGGAVIGGLGIAGGDGEQDRAIAEAAIAAFSQAA